MQPDADPKAFQLQGSDDGQHWTILDSRNDQLWNARREKHTYAVANPAAFHCYRLYITANQTAPVNSVGDMKGGVQVAEWELLDAGGRNLTDAKGGRIAGRLPDFTLNYTALEEKVLRPAQLPIQKTVSLPGTPRNMHRKLFEVRLGTGDDAAEIQHQIDAAARQPAGSNPIVHLPHGTYQLARTVVLPAKIALQIVGDAARDGSALSWNGVGDGPLLTCRGPSRVTMKDLVVNSGSANAITMENCDQQGGRIYCDQVDCIGGYGDGSKWADTDFLIDGVEKSDVFVVNHYLGSAKKAVEVTSGPILGAGGDTKGQIAFMMGYVWGDYSPTYMNVKNGGRLLFCGYRAENAQKGLATLDATSSGRLTWACNNDAVSKYTNTPFVLKGFKGTLCTVANSMWPNEVQAPMFDISGDGSQCKVLSMCNYLGGGLDLKMPSDHIWKDTSNPPAQAATRSCQGIFTDWNWNQLPDVTNQVVNAKPDATFILDCLRQLRGLRIAPPMNGAEGVTDIKLIHVPIDVGVGKTGVIMRAGK